MKIHNYILLFLAVVILLSGQSCQQSAKYKALIVTGQDAGSEGWQVSSEAIAEILENSNIFKVSTKVSPTTGSDMSAFSPGFDSYDVVVLDYNGDDWAESTIQDLDEYVKNGGGLVILRSAGKVFPEGINLNPVDSLVINTSYIVEVQDAGHPIMNGMPLRWMHTNDVMNLDPLISSESPGVLATTPHRISWRVPVEHKPVITVESYGEGRIFSTVMGSIGEEGDPIAFQCAGFILCLQRGAEWAASGVVTQEFPEDMPNSGSPLILNSYKNYTINELFLNAANYETGRSNKYLHLISQRIRNLGGDEKGLAEFEDRILKIMKSNDASADAKNYFCRELSWMGTEKSIPVLEELSADEETEEMAKYALARLK